MCDQRACVNMGRHVLLMFLVSIPRQRMCLVLCTCSCCMDSVGCVGTVMIAWFLSQLPVLGLNK